MCDAVRLANALKGKSASQGGMNLPELKKCAESRGISTAGKKADLIGRLSSAPARSLAVAKKTVQAT